jgi:hypothetical protein
MPVHLPSDDHFQPVTAQQHNAAVHLLWMLAE